MSTLLIVLLGAVQIGSTSWFTALVLRNAALARGALDLVYSGCAYAEASALS